MTLETLSKIVLSLPVVRNLTILSKDAEGKLTQVAVPDDQKVEAVNGIIPIAVAEASGRHSFDFTTDVCDDVTVANQSQYRFTGNNGDCQNVINIRYDTSSTLLEKKNPVVIDQILSGNDETLAVQVWVPRGRVNGFPNIELYGTPTTAGLRLRYRYQRNNITVEDWPEEWASVLTYAVLQYLVPSAAREYEAKLTMMINSYEVGADIDMAQGDPLTVQRNIERNIRGGRY
jgi:hypothetical protein